MRQPTVLCSTRCGHFSATFSYNDTWNFSHVSFSYRLVSMETLDGVIFLWSGEKICGSNRWPKDALEGIVFLPEYERTQPGVHCTIAM